MHRAFTSQIGSAASTPPPVILWTTNRVGRVAFASDAYERYFGVSLAERREGSSGLVHPEDEEAHGRAFANALRLRRPFHAVARVRRADGQWRWMESYGAPRFSSHRRFVGMVGSSTEVLNPSSSSTAPVSELATALKVQTTLLRELMAQLDGGELERAKGLATRVHDELQRIRVAHRSRTDRVSSAATTRQPTSHDDQPGEPLTR